MDRRCYDIFVGHTYVGTWLAIVAKGIDRTFVGWRNGGNDDTAGAPFAVRQSLCSPLSAVRATVGHTSPHTHKSSEPTPTCVGNNSVLLP